MIRIRDGSEFATLRLVDFPDHHQPVRTVVGKRAQYDGVDHAEYGRVGTDAEGQHDHHNKREARSPGKGPEPIPKILDE